MGTGTAEDPRLPSNSGFPNNQGADLIIVELAIYPLWDSLGFLVYRNGGLYWTKFLTSPLPDSSFTDL
jgi:hypothetical protein